MTGAYTYDDVARAVRELRGTLITYAFIYDMIVDALRYAMIAAVVIALTAFYGYVQRCEKKDRDERNAQRAAAAAAERAAAVAVEARLVQTAAEVAAAEAAEREQIYRANFPPTGVVYMCEEDIDRVESATTDRRLRQVGVRVYVGTHEDGEEERARAALNCNVVESDELEGIIYGTRVCRVPICEYDEGDELYMHVDMTMRQFVTRDVARSRQRPPGIYARVEVVGHCANLGDYRWPVDWTPNDYLDLIEPPQDAAHA